MRSQEEMLAIILKKAKQEEHIRAALLQGFQGGQARLLSGLRRGVPRGCHGAVSQQSPLDRLLWQTDHHADPRASYPDPNDLFDAVCRWKPY